MKDFSRMTLAIIVQTNSKNQWLLNKKILGYTSAEWIKLRLSPYFKNVIEWDKNDAYGDDVICVDWDCTLITVDNLKYGNLSLRLNEKNFSYIEKTLQSAILDDITNSGVILHDRQNLVIDGTVKISAGAEIYAPNVIKGNSVIGGNAVVYPYCCLENCSVGEGTVVKSTFAQDCQIGCDCTVGPFASIRPNTSIGDGCRIGNFVEVKNAFLGDGVKSAHLAYIGDADVGANTNIGCGVVFANFDGKQKHKTTVGDNCFLGCNTNLVAPLKLGDNVFVAAGTTVTDDADDNSFIIGRFPSTIKANRK